MENTKEYKEEYAKMEEKLNNCELAVIFRRVKEERDKLKEKKDKLKEQKECLKNVVLLLEGFGKEDIQEGKEEVAKTVKPLMVTLLKLSITETFKEEEAALLYRALDQDTINPTQDNAAG